MSTLKVNEIFNSIQGEGSNIILDIKDRILLKDEIFKKLIELKVLFKWKNTYSFHHNKLNIILNDVKNGELNKKINLYISQFNSKEEAIYCLIHDKDLSDYLCPICNKHLKFCIKSNTYYKTCGNKKCISKKLGDPNSKEKGRKTCKERHGFECAFEIKKYRENAKNKRKQKSGYEYPFQDPKIQNDIKEIHKENLGYEYPFQDPKIQNDIIQTNLTKHNVKNIKQVNMYKEKAMITYHKNHDPENKMIDKDINNIILDIQKIVLNENIDLFNLYCNNDYFILFIKLLYNQKKRKLRINEISNIFNRSFTTIKNKIEKIGILDYFYINDSELEIQFKELLESVGLKQCEDKNDNKDYIRKEKTILPKNKDTQGQPEIDFYFLNYKIGFEINDIMGHNCKKKNIKYHINKTLQCKEKGIRLIHLWEWELIDEIKWIKISQWVLNLLNNQKQEINVDDCTIIQITHNEEQDFLNQYNLEEYMQSDICLGLYYNNELIQVISFKLLENNNYELLRNCIKFGYNIQNGVKKLLNYFIQNNNVNSIIAYCNLDKFSGTTFEEIGFKLVEYIKPELILYNKKDELNMYKKIYNCGKNVYTLQLEEKINNNVKD